MLKNTLFLLLLVCTIKGFSQVDYAVSTIPPVLKSRANAVLRDMETTVDMRGIDNVLVTTKKVITVLNKNGDQRAILSIGYDKSNTIQRIKGQVLDADGRAVGKFTQSDFLDESVVNDGSLFIGYRVKYYSPNARAYPYTIIYEYEVKNKQNLILPDWYANPSADLSVEKNKYTFISKPGEDIRIKAYNYKGEPEIVKSEKATTYTWSAQNLPAFKTEQYAPDPDDYKTYVRIAAKQFSYFGYKGSYQNWDELGKWTYNTLIKDRQQLPASTIADVQELVKGIDGDREKAKKIYEYLQKKTRYISVQIGIGGLQPMPATEVDQLAYGDCKALVNYMQSLLKAVNIPSLYCVVNSGSFKKNMDADFASMDQGDHIILCIPLKADTAWVDCTSTTNPFGYLGDFTDDRTVLACTAEGGKLLKTPALTSQMNLLKRKAELTVDQEGNVTGQLQTTFSGSQYDNYDYIIEQPYSEQLKLLKKKYDIDNINFSDFRLSQDKGNNPATSESLKLEIPKYVASSNNHAYLVLNAFNKSGSVLDSRSRTLPLYINRGYTDEDELIYHLPEGYTVEGMPENRSINSIFGSYSINIKLEGKTLTYQRKIHLKNGTYPPEKYGDFASFINDISRADQNRLVFKTK